MMSPPNKSMGAPVNVSTWVGTMVVAPDGHVEGEINEVVIDDVTGSVRYFVVAVGDVVGRRATRYALPFSDCLFDEKGDICIAKAMYPLRR